QALQVLWHECVQANSHTYLAYLSLKGLHIIQLARSQIQGRLFTIGQKYFIRRSDEIATRSPQKSCTIHTRAIRKIDCAYSTPSETANIYRRCGRANMRSDRRSREID